MKKKTLRKIFLSIIVFFIFILSLFLYIAQPDYGGSKQCYRLTGICAEYYKGAFVPEFSVPSFLPSSTRFKFNLERSDFSVLKHDLETQYGCVWTKDPGETYYPGMEIRKDGDIMTLFERGDNAVVWLNYNPQEEYLYIGWFSH